MSAPSNLLEEGTEVLFFGQTGKARHGKVVGLAVLGDDPKSVEIVGYAVQTKWEVRPVAFEAICAPFGDGYEGVDMPDQDPF